MQTSRMKISPKLHIASLQILNDHGAVPISTKRNSDTKEGDNRSIQESMTKVNSKDCGQIVNDTDENVIGITISNWDISTSMSTIGNEREMDMLTDQMERLANTNNSDAIDDHESVNTSSGTYSSHEMKRRRLCIPEIVFVNSFVHLKLKKDPKKLRNTELNNNIFEIIFNAADALGEWALCHSHLNLNFNCCKEQSRTFVNDVKNDAFRGVSILQSIDAKSWSNRRSKLYQHNDITTDTSKSCFNQSQIYNSLNTTSEFNYDWTFSSPYTGTSILYCHPTSNEKIVAEWHPSTTSLIDFRLLTDQSQPILYYDDINLYEDDMHDNGYVSLSCKVRVMPSCFYILMSLFVRVDHVLIRVKEVRVFCSFSLTSKTNSKYRICKDVTWKECKWDDLKKMNLPSFVGSWRIEDENGGQATQQQIQGFLKRLPCIDLPNDMYRHSYIDIS